MDGRLAGTDKQRWQASAQICLLLGGKVEVVWLVCWQGRHPVAKVGRKLLVFQTARIHHGVIRPQLLHSQQ
eukprot:1157213-Pelagomonas_calceolata.AAC.11